MSFLKNSRKRGVLAPNLYEKIMASGQEDEFFFKTDIHWRPVGAELVAQEISKEIAAFDARYATLTKTEFTTTNLQEEFQDGGKAMRIKEICGIEIPPETFIRSVTENQSLGLLDEESPEEVVLLGTSMSNRGDDRLNYNFSGYLSQNLSLNVLNAAVGGGGPLTAMLDYFLSIDYAQLKPAFVIWEFPVWQIGRARDISEYRQIIPSIFGSCSQESLVYNEISLNKGETLMINNHLDGIMGSDYYLYFELSDKTLVNFDITIKYDNNVDETIKIERSTRVQNEGTFFLELSDEISESMQAIVMDIPNDTSATASVYLCKTPEF